MDKAVCISHSHNTLGKSMNPTILLPAMSKQQGRLGSLTLERWTGIGERKLWVQIC